MRVVIFSVLLCVALLPAPAAYACNTCGCTICHLGKSPERREGQKWYARFLYDQVVWRDKSAQQQHTLHHQGHDVHDRTRDVMYHYQIGRHITDDLNIMMDIPYMTKEALDIEHHGTLGAKDRSKGLSDLQVLAEYRMWHNDRHAVGVAGGVKLPTGSTRQKNAQGERYETDMQPGTGAAHFIAGGTYRFENGPVSVLANASHVFTREGAQEFQYGDVSTASLLAEYCVNPQADWLRTRVGADTVFQYETEEKREGDKNPDSGGHILFVGPSVRIDTTPNVTLTGTFLYPAIQRLNGFTQEEAFRWVVGTEVRF